MPDPTAARHVLSEPPCMRECYGTYQYDAAGRRERMIANIGDGPRHFIYSYDADGRLSTVDFDHPAGDAIESRYTFHYDCE